MSIFEILNFNLTILNTEKNEIFILPCYYLLHDQQYGLIPMLVEWSSV